VGDAAPDFELEGSSGRIRLAGYQRSRNVAIFFMREFG
jgi:peroxiredoxin